MPRKNSEPYSHEVIRHEDTGSFFSEGKTFTFKIYPSKLSAYALSIGLLYGRLSPEAIKHYEQELTSRAMGYIEEACDCNYFDIDRFMPVFRNNIPYVIANALNRDYKQQDYRMPPKRAYKLDQYEKEARATIFSMRLRDTFHLLAKDDRVKNTCDDYALVQEVLANPKKFPALERLVAGPINSFAHQRHIDGIDMESQRQEGLLAIWSAAPNYRALRFARFSSFAKKALDFKFKNMLRSTMTMKRKANRRLVLMGGTINSQDSFFTHLLDRMTLEHWEEQQRVYDSLSGLLDMGISSVCHDGDFEDNLETLNEANTNMHVRMCTPAELNNDVLNLSARQKRFYFDNQIPLDAFETRAFLRKDFEQGKICSELTQSNFPHMNEAEVLYDANEVVLEQYRDDEYQESVPLLRCEGNKQYEVPF